MHALGYSMFGINVVVVLACAVWLKWHQNAPLVRSSQPSLLYWTLAGCLVSSGTILALSVESSDAACAIFPWLYSIGFCITFSCLFVKIGRSSSSSSSLHGGGGGGGESEAEAEARSRSSGSGSAVVVPALIALDVVFLAVWMARDPLRWRRTALQTDVFGFTLSSTGQCEADTSASYLAIIGTLHTAVLAYACYACWRTGKMTAGGGGGGGSTDGAKAEGTGYSEAKYVALAMVSNLQVFVLGVPASWSWRVGGTRARPTSCAARWCS